MRKSIPILLGCILLGAAVNIGIAALLPLYTPQSAMLYGNWIRDGSSVWPRQVPASWKQKPIAAMEAIAFGFRQVIAHESLAETGSKTDDNCTLVVHESGWPLRALAAEYWHSPASKGGRHFFEINAPNWLGERKDNVACGGIGTCPLWTGLIVNTLFFGMMFFLSVVGFREVRQRIFKMPDSCPRCGYDCQALVNCPECGRARSVVSNGAAPASSV